jgi:hypothetical protein
VRKPALRTSHRNPFKKADKPEKPQRVKPQRVKPLKDRDRVGKKPRKK